MALVIRTRKLLSWCFFTLLLHSPGLLAADGFSLCETVYRSIFHEIGEDVSTTTLRQELKVTVDKRVADNFYEFLKSKSETGDLVARDSVPNGLKAVTHTEYFPSFDVTDELGIRFKAKIRIRTYFNIPEGESVDDYQGRPLTELNRAKLVDNDDGAVYSKLEFKVGHPEKNSKGELRDVFGVVDKVGVVLSRKDIDWLFKDKNSYLRHRNAIFNRAKAYVLTGKKGKKKVNNPIELKRLIERIGLIHEVSPAKGIVPESEIRYARKAYVIPFKPKGENAESIDVQITFDKDIHYRDLKEKSEIEFDDEARVIELKIPVAYATLSDQELETKGLGVGSSRVDLQACKLEYSIVSPK